VSIKNPLENYIAGSVWKTRQDINPIPEDALNVKIHKKKTYGPLATSYPTIKRNERIFILKIVEDICVTHIKFLYENKVYYLMDIDDMSLTFIYDEDKVFL
jgi:hypothetical protein